ncbi:hypothetical protein LX32DRAFT_714364 [Colletotrichum zoysiae]|uniref:Uncharacterized protein n=1 Tax=Colletotrichum zoysiae TaxID=1216348 RepID=A0AAD9HLL4_9PEZI|nr:hypothetical protein LX32DRAFT_714364 [Colletotrichum zoysiae]
MTRHHRNLALHHLTVLAVLSTTVLPGASAIEDLDPGDVPAGCALACAPIAQLTGRCEAAAEQKFGAEAVSRRWTAGKQRRADAVDGGNGGPDQDTWQRRRRRRRQEKGTTRSLQRMLGSRLDRRQEELADEEAGEGAGEASEESSDDSDDSDDSDSSDSEEEEEEEEEEEKEKEDRLASGNAAETGGGEEAAAAVEANQQAAVEAMRACVCGETGFDVAGAAFGCAACVAQNATAEDANEDIRQIMANCGFVAATDPVTTAATTTTAFPNAMSSTLPPLLLAPAASGTETSPPPSPASPTSPSFPPATTTRAPDLESVTPVTVFVPPFSTLPPLVLPNDVASAPPVLEQDSNQLSAAAKGPGPALRGRPGPGWLVVPAAVIGLLLS